MKTNIAKKVLKEYNGLHPYLIYLKNYVKKNKLTINQAKYVLKEHKTKPLELNKVIQITDYQSESIKKEHNLDFLPKRIYVHSILHESNEALHVLCKFTTKGDYKFQWLNKKNIITDIFLKKIDVNINFNLINEVNKLDRTLYPHQEEGVNFLVSRNRCILAHSMGLGKTTTSIASVKAAEQHLKKDLKVLIICPASVKINWKREVEAYYNEDEVNVVSSRLWQPNKFTIINFDIVKNFHSEINKNKKYDDYEFSQLNTELIKYEFDIIIIDEAHYLKNNKSKRSKLINNYIDLTNPEYVWMLTGTPIANRPMDFFNLLKITRHRITDDWLYYARRYCDAKKIRAKGGKTIWLTDGSSNLDELYERTKSLVLRKSKEEVLDNLPDKIIMPFYLELDKREQNEYDNLFDDYINKLNDEGKDINVVRQLTETLLLRKFISDTKIERTIELAESIIEKGEKVIIFTNFNDELEEFVSHFGRTCRYIHGGVDNNKRQQMIDDFETNEKVKVFVGQIKAAGTGITLLKGTSVIFNSLDWVPGNTEQATDRSYRIGQINDVKIYFPLFANTVDELVWEALFNKSKNINKILNDKNSIFFKKIVDNL